MIVFTKNTLSQPRFCSPNAVPMSSDALALRFLAGQLNALRILCSDVSESEKRPTATIIKRDLVQKRPERDETPRASAKASDDVAGAMTRERCGSDDVACGGAVRVSLPGTFPVRHLWPAPQHGFGGDSLSGATGRLI